jgi:transposase
LDLTRFGGRFLTFVNQPIPTMPRTRPPYPQEFRNRIIELARNGRAPKDLAEEFEPTATTIRNWLEQADRDEGKSADGLSTDEREELRELRKKLRQLKQERDILAKATAWFARETGDVPPKSSSS